MQTDACSHWVAVEYLDLHSTLSHNDRSVSGKNIPEDSAVESSLPISLYVVKVCHGAESSS